MMREFKKFSGVLLLCAAGFVFNPAWALDTMGPARPVGHGLMHRTGTSQVVAGAQAFIDGMAQRAIGFLDADDISEEQRKEEFRKLLHDSFDMQTLGRFSLGRYWKTSTDAQKREYQKLFEDMIVEVYSRRFNDYNGQALEVRDVKPEGDADAVVNSFIVPESGPEVQVDWRVRYKNGHYKIVDVIVEGVSMALTQRSDFASVIQRGGGDVNVLLEHLRK